MLVDLDIDDRGVARLTLDRPEARNPTSIGMLNEMDGALDRAESAVEPVRVVVLAGAGRAFCSGLDLDEVRAGVETIHRLLTRLGEVMRRLRRFPAPVVAVVQGAAIGGGFGLMNAADFAVTHPEAKLGYPAVASPLSPALMAPWLSRKIGPSRARAFLLRGGTITGAEAHALGIATDLAERSALDACANDLVDTLLTSVPHATQMMKAALNVLDGSLDDAPLDLAARTSAEIIAHPDAQARLRELLG